ncbi:hypothetical protein [Rhodospira trueperi]|uniref:Uncharacterized protein n=1 Tax=Rhodospira trueperi TaxID=69960 RepID=A0A1G7BF22_9PROT|nr:hypothetical protein [Rhodospira trueperi]SDE25567.1 hypothetical protein SAMN05421720_1055 [Rhodospira trueperi]
MPDAIPRRTVIKAVALAGAAASVPLAVLSPIRAPEPDPTRHHLGGFAVMQIGGRRLLVDLIRAPEPGDEVVALTPVPAEATRALTIFRAADFQPPQAAPMKRRVYWHRTEPTDAMVACEAIGVVVIQGGPAPG